jgi:D-arabinose 5-phosphate isomerase GutQ
MVVNVEDELFQQTQILAEALRTASTELLEVTRRVNNAYAQYADFCVRLQEQAFEDAPEDLITTVPMDGIEVPAGVTFSTKDLCENCNAYLPEEDSYCILCGTDRGE